MNQIERPAPDSPAPAAQRPQLVGEEWRALIGLFLAACGGSLFIALYVLSVGVFTVHKMDTDIVAKSALMAARKLSTINVENGTFGRVGLIDMPYYQPEEATTANPSPLTVSSLNKIYGTLLLDLEIANRLKSKRMKELIFQDLENARKVEFELTSRLYEAVEQEPFSSLPQPYTDNFARTRSPEAAASESAEPSVYQQVYKLLSEQKPRDATLVDLKVSIGFAAGNKYQSQVPRTTARTGEEPLYPAGQPIAVERGNPIWLVALAKEVQQIDPSDFEMVNREGAPSAVLVEATFQSKPTGPEGSLVTAHKRACAIVGGERAYATPSTLVLHFPHGMPPLFQSVQQILNYTGWLSKGEWQQAVAHEVPGRGSLAPSLEPVLPGMSPSDAAAVAIYHWLRQMGPDVNPDRFINHMSAVWRWSSPPASTAYGAEPEERVNPVNSCIAVDTGAREYAIMNQTGPGAVGQLGLSRCFDIPLPSSIVRRTSVIPHSAIPLFVDSNGRCNLPGRSGFDKELLAGYMTSLYETNLAAFETYAAANLMIDRTKVLLSESDQKMFIQKQELESVSLRMNRLAKELPAAALAPMAGTNFEQEQTKVNQETLHQYRLTKSRFDALRLLIATAESNRSFHRRVQEAARHVLSNASHVASTTFEICQRSSSLCRDGLYRTDKPPGAYILGTKMIFLPLVKPIQESEFYEFARDEKRQESSSSIDVHWSKRNLNVLLDIKEAFKLIPDKPTIDGRPLDAVLDQVRPQRVVPLTVILDGKSPPRVQSYETYPFSNLRIPAGQLFYYCRTAARTGSNPEVNWSVTIRDFVATRSDQAGGEPVPSHDAEWCKSEGHDACPGLACELQLRTPLPDLSDLKWGASLTNPVTEEKVQQVPPVPADML